MKVEVITAISATPEKVWSVLTDVERWPEWSASMSEVRRLEAGPLEVGSQARIKQPRLPTLVWTVTALVPGESFAWQAHRFGLTLVASHRVVNETGGVVRVTFAVTYHGAMGPLLELLTSRNARRNVQMEAEGLKRRAEMR